MAKKSKHGRGKQRRQAAREERVGVEKVLATSPQAPAEEPTFWFGFEVPWAKLVLGRFVFFLLLAIDSLLNFSHAPRYGAGDFNVAQLPLLDGLAPTRPSYAIGQLVCAYLFVLIACGAATRIALPIVAAIYGWLYFGSHLDSYQHHYLVWLILVLSCFVPWQKPVDAVPATRIRTWAVRLILVQLGILYLWAAISKMNPAWVDGRTLSQQIAGSMKSLITSTVGFKIASVMVILVELTLACTVWIKRTWWIAALLGLLLHLGIVMTGLEIGLFAWLMIGMYIFVIPDRIWVWLAERSPLPTLRGFLGVVGEWFAGAAGWILWVTAAAMGLILALVARYDHAGAVGLVLIAALIGLTIHDRKHVARIALAHLAAFSLWTIVDRGTTTAPDYYRFWGGSSRRLGDTKTAEYAYRKMTEVAPNEGAGHYQLGKLLLAREASDEGLAELRRAEELEPLKARAYVAEAKWLAQHGRRDEAIAKAREGTIVEP
ncbi:MAG TPA: HTTM domain-containing protein, partial [Kofleriaceae bacterium]|nr:HTTM domain-containing protein [Kofleriaceae bacterium]